MELLRLSDDDRGRLYRLTQSMDNLSKAIDGHTEQTKIIAEQKMTASLVGFEDKSAIDSAVATEMAQDRFPKSCDEILKDIDVTVRRTSARETVLSIKGCKDIEDAREKALTLAGNIDFGTCKEGEPDYDVARFEWFNPDGSKNSEEG